KILELSPNNPHALNNLCYLYAEYGVNTQMAQELCQRAVDMDPANPGFRDSLGWAALKNRDFKKAEEELKKSLSMKMNVYDTHYHLATVYYATGELDKAAEHYQEAIKIRPDSAEALNNLAYLYTEQNSNIKQAIEMAETAVQLEKNNASYIDTLGWAYYRDGDLDKALVYLLKANQIVSGQGEVLLHIGRVYLDKNDFDSAIAYLKEAFKADPKLKDPDNSLYLAVRLKSYHSALADYHTLMGERADKERINNILMSIARLYQEEKLYDKAIDITKLCSDVKSGIRPLSEPLFNSYNLADSSKPSLTLDEAPDSATASESLQIAAPEAQTTSENAESEKPVDKLFNGLPPVSSHTLVISFGPQFFRWLGTSIAGAANFADKSVTIFVNKPFKPRKNAVIRIETESITGTAMLGLLSNYFSQLNIVRKNDEQPDRCEFSLGKRRIYAVADRNSVYLSGRLLSEGDRIELLSQLCPFNPESFIELIYNWENFAAFIPQMLQPFVKNPFAPFIRIHTKYSYKDGNLNEFSAATTGKAENDEFMKRFARSLFAFKVQTQQMGLETVIKVRGDEDVIYISTDFENIAGWLTKRFNRWYGLASKLLEIYMSRTICFMNRMFYSPELEKSCPTGGSIRTDAVSGLIYCNQHNEVPAIPMILDEHACCSYNRTRLFRYLQNTRAINASGTLETGSIEELAKKLGVPLCPTTGTWTIDAKGIKCSEHEN
ncbi:MAG TPA: tetratricopeptide repeat protein, partial [Candidatus Rifleibacterium sp.]|nr:tetratricopeptide repeat protein [Candidatus Rifleibacterium sp.]